MELTVSEIDRKQAGLLYPTLLTPRPIALIGTHDSERGRVNLAPYSSVSFVVNNPPMIAVSFSPEHDRPKETLRLALASRQLVLNLVTRAHAGLVMASAEHPEDGRAAEDAPDDYARLRAERSDFAGYAAGRLSDAPAALGCDVTTTHDLAPSRCTLLVAEVRSIYLADAWHARGDKAATASDLFASIAGEQYIGIGDCEPFFLARTW